MSTTESRILLRADHLTKVIEVIAEASSRYQAGDAPAHFTETIHIDHADGEHGEVTVFTATDGYRFHRVELYGADAMNHGSVLLPVNWILDLLPKMGENGLVEICHEAKQRGNKNIVDHHVFLTYKDNADPQGSYFDQEVVWDMDTMWPDVEKLFDPDDYVATDTEVCFNVGFMRDMFEAMTEWWDDYGTDNSFPLRVRNFVPSKVNRFTLHNDIGELTVGICPALPQDYGDYEDDDEAF